MTGRRARLVLFWIAVAVLAAALPAVYGAMPKFGDHPLPYGDMINRLGPIERHVTNMVSAVNFDFRGFDTLGEEIMLMTAVTGTAVLLVSRAARDWAISRRQFRGGLFRRIPRRCLSPAGWPCPSPWCSAFMSCCTRRSRRAAVSREA